MISYLQDNEDQVLENALLEIGKHYPFEPADLPDLQFGDFESLKYYSNFLNRKTVRLLETNTYVSFVEVEFQELGAKSAIPYTVKYFQCYIFCFRQFDYGRVFIRRETFADKINELVHPMEVDFAQDATFSKEYYVSASNKMKAVDLLNEQLRKALVNTNDKDLFIEVVNNIVLMGNKRTVEADNVTVLAKVGFEVDKSIRY